MGNQLTVSNSFEIYATFYSTEGRNIYRKYLNLVNTQVEIISDPNYLGRTLFER